MLNVRLDELTAEHIRDLVDTGVQETFDLDFKAALYGRGDSDRRALAGDIAALANTAGGIIVIGVEEDDQARASAARGVEITDGEIARMRQVAASLTAPMPQFDIIALPDPQVGDNYGFLVLAVPRSTAAPHAVLINEALRYPKRNGATTRYLSEAEVATAYHDRMVGLADQEQRLAEAESAACARVDLTEPWVVVSLVPDIPGEMIISQHTFNDFKQHTVHQPATIVPTFVSFGQASVGQRCFIADDSAQRYDKAHSTILRLQTDASGSYGHRLHHLDGSRRRPQPEDEESFLIWDEVLVLSVISGLLQLGQHARDRAATGGNALVRVTLRSEEQRTIELGHTRHYGIVESRSSFAEHPPITSAALTVSLDDIATPGPPLLRIAALLSGEIAQAFGVIDLGQISSAGAIQPEYWARDGWKQPLLDWAQSNGIGTVG